MDRRDVLARDTGQKRAQPPGSRRLLRGLFGPCEKHSSLFQRGWLISSHPMICRFIEIIFQKPPDGMPKTWSALANGRSGLTLQL